MKAKYGIKDERKELWACLDEWDTELNRAASAHSAEAPKEAELRPFRGGATPDWGDVAVYGVLGAADGVPLGAELRTNAPPAVASWLVAMDAAVPPPNFVK